VSQVAVDGTMIEATMTKAAVNSVSLGDLGDLGEKNG
jgi:hypothetical protein